MIRPKKLGCKYNYNSLFPKITDKMNKRFCRKTIKSTTERKRAMRKGTLHPVQNSKSTAERGFYLQFLSCLFPLTGHSVCHFTYDEFNVHLMGVFGGFFYYYNTDICGRDSVKNDYKSVFILFSSAFHIFH